LDNCTTLENASYHKGRAIWWTAALVRWETEQAKYPAEDHKANIARCKKQAKHHEALAMYMAFEMLPATENR
jgi:hypothetical protein